MSFFFFDEIWTSIVIWPRWPQKGLRGFFQELHFWNQSVPAKKMKYVSAFLSKFSLNLSLKEVCQMAAVFLRCTLSWSKFRPGTWSVLLTVVWITLLAVISLWLARNNTTSLFSFLIGTISNRHQNGFWPENKNKR